MRKIGKYCIYTIVSLLVIGCIKPKEKTYFLEDLGLYLKYTTFRAYGKFEFSNSPIFKDIFLIFERCGVSNVDIYIVSSHDVYAIDYKKGTQILDYRGIDMNIFKIIEQEDPYLYEVNGKLFLNEQAKGYYLSDSSFIEKYHYKVRFHDSAMDFSIYNSSGREILDSSEGKIHIGKFQ